MRGNRRLDRFEGRRDGSIPARAGEPFHRRAPGETRLVYPRACGGTLHHDRATTGQCGLSPRVRGNQAQRISPVVDRGSIPARAGEPRRTLACQLATEVYPRACGGTRHGCPATCSPWGLSPRVRGNREFGREVGGVDGSIPARAGEPEFNLPGRVGDAVYPRACGGTSDEDQFDNEFTGLSPRVRGNRFGISVMLMWPRSIPARAGEPFKCCPIRSCIKVYPRACGGTCLPPDERIVVVRSIPARAGEPTSCATCLR